MKHILVVKLTHSPYWFAQNIHENLEINMTHTTNRHLATGSHYSKIHCIRNWSMWCNELNLIKCEFAVLVLYSLKVISRQRGALGCLCNHLLRQSQQSLIQDGRLNALTRTVWPPRLGHGMWSVSMGIPGKCAHASIITIGVEQLPILVPWRIRLALHQNMTY